jgi:hypothetical protein
MNANEFIECTATWFEAWFRFIKTKISSHEINVTGEYSFPGILRVGESPHHYIAELTGAKNIENPDEYSIRRPTSTEGVRNTAAFINPGFPAEDNATRMISISSQDNIFMHLTFATPFAQEEFHRRINVPLNPAQLQASFDAEVPVVITETADKLVLRDIDIVRSQGPEIYFRRISTVLVLRKTIGEEELRAWLSEKARFMFMTQLFSDVLGINLYYSVSEEGFAVQLLSLSQQDVCESTIDTFIRENASFFAKALGYRDAISQQQLQIINAEGLTGEYLQPDYLMLREDDGYDILDLKKALMSRQTTVGTQNRIRFSAYVAELIGQLEGYRRYFSLRENRDWVMSNLGINVSDNPRLIGIVGNHNNFERDQVDLAMGAYRDNISILSYAEIVNLLRKPQFRQ